MKKLNIKLNHHDRVFGISEELNYAIDELKKALEAGSFEVGTFDDGRAISGKVETDNYVIQILPKNKEVTNNE